MLQILIILQQIVFPQSVDTETYPRVYPCEVRTLSQVYDADTITKPDCHLGMGVKVRIRPGLRLYGFDAPEVRGETKLEGRRCRDALRQTIKDNDMKFEFLAVRDGKGEERKGKYGRPLGHMFIDGQNVALRLMEADCATVKDYD